MTEEASRSSKHLPLSVTGACFDQLSLGADKRGILRTIAFSRKRTRLCLSPIASSVSLEQKKSRVLGEERRVHDLTVPMGELRIRETLIKAKGMTLSAMGVKTYRHHIFPVTRRLMARITPQGRGSLRSSKTLFEMYGVIELNAGPVERFAGIVDEYPTRYSALIDRGYSKFRVSRETRH
jgi:hypothetical protein